MIQPFYVPVCSKTIEILYQDDSLLLINKPNGLLSLTGKHPLNDDSSLRFWHFRYYGCGFKQSSEYCCAFFYRSTKTSGESNEWLNTRIWLDPFGPAPGFWLSSTDESNNYAIDSAKGIVNDWEGNAVHAGFRVSTTGFYRVRVHARSTGNSGFNIDDTSLICMN